MTLRPVFSNLDLVRQSWPEFCHHLFEVATQNAHPSRCLPPALSQHNDWHSVNVISAGKGAIAMAEALLATWSEKDIRGLVIAPHADTNAKGIEPLNLLHGAHPIPDANSVAAGQAALMQAASTKSDELLLFLLTGGASALVCCPSEQTSLAQKQEIIDQMLRGGAAIDELNIVRRSLSLVKGGGLLYAAEQAGGVQTLAISDVVGDQSAFIGSGPTIPRDDEEIERAKAIVKQYGFDPELFDFSNDKSVAPPNGYAVIGSAKTALSAVKDTLQGLGFHVVDLGQEVEGEARDIARQHAQIILRQTEASGQPLAFLSGGELTVSVSGKGMGGPNQEYCLALLAELSDHECFYGLAFDTDGTDGCGGAAGAYFSPVLSKKMADKGMKPRAFLEDNDSGGFFREFDGLLETGASGTNVNDVRLICWLPDQ